MEVHNHGIGVQELQPAPLFCSFPHLGTGTGIRGQTPILVERLLECVQTEGSEGRNTHMLYLLKAWG